MTPIKFELHNLSSPLLIAGLGNIGVKYAETRHNAGFMFTAALEVSLQAAGYESKNIQEELYEAIVFPELQLTLLMPKTLMNLSGQALKEYYRYHHNYRSKDLVVVHDDLDLLLGDFKINAGKGPRLHNGLRSIEQELGNEFIRIRIGIENRNGLPISGLDYVLYKFTATERLILNKTIASIISERFSF